MERFLYWLIKHEAEVFLFIFLLLLVTILCPDNRLRAAALVLDLAAAIVLDIFVILAWRKEK